MWAYLLHQMFDELNQIYPTKKLAMNHNTNPNESEDERCESDQQESIPFLDKSE